MDDQGHVLVIGAASLDVKGHAHGGSTPGTSAPGHIRSSIGGVARNIAENLVRLEVDTMLLTAVGDDGNGERILGHAAASGIDVNHALIVPGARTCAYMALLHENGSLDRAIDDMEVMKHLTPEYIDKHNAAFDNARLVMIDANLPDKSIETVVWLCRDRGIPLAADPTSVPLAARLRPYLKSFYLVSPNAAETAALCEKTFDPSDPDAAGKAAWQLVQKGVEVAVVTLSEFGVVYRSGETKGHIPALKTNVVDQTGAGDAQTAAILFGLLEGIPLDEAVRLGVTAASLTLRSRETVRHDLSVELLYDELVI